MVQGILIGVAADGVTGLGNEPLPFSTVSPSNTITKTPLPISVATAD